MLVDMPLHMKLDGHLGLHNTNQLLYKLCEVMYVPPAGPACCWSDDLSDHVMRIKRPPMVATHFNKDYCQNLQRKLRQN